MQRIIEQRTSKDPFHSKNVEFIKANNLGKEISPANYSHAMKNCKVTLSVPHDSLKSPDDDKLKYFFTTFLSSIQYKKTNAYNLEKISMHITSNNMHLSFKKKFKLHQKEV